MGLGPIEGSELCQLCQKSSCRGGGNSRGDEMQNLEAGELL